MRRDDPPYLFALECKGGAMVVCETPRPGGEGSVTEYGGRDGHWSRTPKGILPFKSFDAANGEVKHLREQQAGHFGRR